MDDLVNDGSAQSAAELIGNIPAADQYTDSSEMVIDRAPEAPAKARDPDGKFAKPEAEGAEVKEPEAGDEAQDDDDEYLEYDVASDTEGEAPRKERLKLSEALEGYKESKALKAQLEEARTSQPLPEEYEQRLVEVVQERTQYKQAIMQWMASNQPKQPNRELLNQHSPIWNPDAYYQQLNEYDEAVANQAAANQEVERIQQLNSQEQEALNNSRLTRESRALEKVWPELKDKAVQSKVIAGMHEHYGLDAKTIQSVTDHRFYAMAKDALELRALKAAKQEAVRVVREKPKLVRAAARSTSNSAAANYDSAFGRLAKSGSFSDAAAALSALRKH